MGERKIDGLEGIGDAMKGAADKKAARQKAEKTRNGSPCFAIVHGSCSRCPLKLSTTRPRCLRAALSFLSTSCPASS